MSIRRTHQTSDAEKKLKQLQQQIYGKSVDLGTNQLQEKQRQYSLNQTTINNAASTKTMPSDLAYLKIDLIKIALFSFLAIGAELLIYFLSSKHIINLSYQFIS